MKQRSGNFLARNVTANGSSCSTTALSNEDKYVRQRQVSEINLLCDKVSFCLHMFGPVESLKAFIDDVIHGGNVARVTL